MENLRLKIKWLDPITLTTLPFLVLIPSILVSSMIIYIQKRYFIFLILILIILILFLIWIKLIKHIDDNDDKYPGMLLENNYDGNVKIRSENGTIICVKKTDKYPIPVDGINTFIKGDMIYKVRSGTNVKINKDGTISEYSLISCLINSWTNINALPNDWKELNKSC
ncbi:MAG: hypothetical protein AB1304_02890 [Bacteroidota bacterium]